MDQAPVAEALEVGIADPVVRFVMVSGCNEPAVLLQIMVDFPEPFRPVDDREKPGGPAQGFVLVHLEEFPVEAADQGPGGLLRVASVPGAPAPEGMGFPPDFPLQLFPRGA